MAIPRTADQDDDGTLTFGTPHDNAWKTGLYDQIDARWSVVTTTATAQQDNFAYSEADVLLCNNASGLVITGLLAPAAPVKPGKPLTIISVGAGQVNLRDQNTSSTAANRIITGTAATKSTVDLAPGSGICVVTYDSVATRWRVRSHNQGAAIAYASVWTNTGTANTLGNGTVTATYYERGREVTVQIVLTWGSTTVSGNGSWTFATPTTAAANNPIICTCLAQNAGVQNYGSGGALLTGLTLTPLSSVVAGGGFTATVPFTWGVGDSLTVMARYFSV